MRSFGRGVVFSLDSVVMRYSSFSSASKCSYAASHHLFGVTSRMSSVHSQSDSAWRGLCMLGRAQSRVRMTPEVPLFEFAKTRNATSLECTEAEHQRSPSSAATPRTPSVLQHSQGAPNHYHLNVQCKGRRGNLSTTRKTKPLPPCAVDLKPQEDLVSCLVPNYFSTP